MSKVSRIIESVDLNTLKYLLLVEQAKLLGILRKEVWQRFGSINGVGVCFRKRRNNWVKTRDFLPLPAKAWKETLRDTLDDIKLYEESAKEKVRKIIYKHKDNKELFKLLKNNYWINNSYLCRLMRKYKKHGKTTVNNQIILEAGVYGQFTGKNGNTWLKIPSFIRGKPICVPLNSNIKLQGMLRLILKDGIVFVHYTINQKQYQASGEQIIGVDKGYTEAFADSEGNFYGENFGKLLGKYTDKVNSRGKARNKLKAIADKLSERLDTNPKIRKKRDHIYKFNLGTKKLHKNNKKQKELIRNIAFQSVHAIVDTAKEVRAEDLTKPIISKEKWKKYNRRISGWAKGALAEALESVTKARGSCLRLVNCAYTSQMDSNTHFLEGKRVGDKFYHASGEVSHADTNAARNIKHRGDDTEITRYTPFIKVKKILLNRLMAIGGVSYPNG
jgi:hypothetical protein